MRRELIPASEISSSIPAPVGGEEFANLMRNFAPFSGRIAVAVSGGPDSMALALCMKRWVGDITYPSPILCFIVDHNLRPESGVEAGETRKTLEKWGIAAEILRWDHLPVVSKLQAMARKARYRLLIEACHRHDIRELLFAHQREDQAETILMRFAKGSGVDGLAGIAAQKWLGDVRVLRPFLSVPKERLIATCNTAKISFIADPSNDSTKFARGRLRRVMTALAEEGLSLDRLLDLGDRAGEVRDALDYYTNALLRVAAKRDEAGALFFDLEQLRSAPRAIALRALGLCLQYIHAQDYGPERASLAALRDALGADHGMDPRTLHGCLIAKNEKQAIFMREYAAVTDAPIIRSGETVVWDGRWLVTLDDYMKDSFTIRPLGNPPHETVDKIAPDLRRRVPQGRVRASLPCLWDGEKPALMPVFDEEEAPVRARLLKTWP